MTSQRRQNHTIELELQETASTPSIANPQSHGDDVGHIIEDIVADTIPPAGYQQLERADGGGPAWRILCAAFMFEAILWGE